MIFFLRRFLFGKNCAAFEKKRYCVYISSAVNEKVGERERERERERAQDMYMGHMTDITGT